MLYSQLQSAFVKLILDKDKKTFLCLIWEKAQLESGIVGPKRLMSSIVSKKITCERSELPSRCLYNANVTDEIQVLNFTESAPYRCFNFMLHCSANWFLNSKENDAKTINSQNTLNVFYGNFATLGFTQISIFKLIIAVKMIC